MLSRNIFRTRVTSAPFRRRYAAASNVRTPVREIKLLVSTVMPAYRQSASTERSFTSSSKYCRISAAISHAEEAYGYAFEKLVLCAWSLGIGTTWIGGTMKRELFERAAGLAAGEMMPCVTPLGYPAKNRSLREMMMRKGVGADSRLPAEKLFFDGRWDAPLAPEKQAAMADLIEMVRWAPSAVNKQPWRIIVTDQGCHFYEKKDKGFVSDKTGDLQRIDVGIALCHFVMGLEEQGKQPEVVIENPGLPVPEGVKYVATVRVPE